MPRKPRPVTIGDVTYEGGVPELAEKYGIHPNRIWDRRKKGWLWEEALGIKPREVKTGRKAPPVKIGKKIFHGGIPEIAEQYGLTQELIRSRRNSGWPWEEILGKKPRKKHRSDTILIEIGGRTYDAAEAARVFEVGGSQPGHKIRSRIKAGWSPRQAVGLDPAPKRKIKKKRQKGFGRSYPIPEGHGTVYLITNRLNGKQYVGITASTFKHRKIQYRSATKSENENRPIIRAMRKYGIENFKFEIVDRTAKTFPELLGLEEKYIQKYGTYKSGYNASTGGEYGGQSITIHDVEYPSIAIAALTHGIDPGIFRQRLNVSGMSPEEAVEYEFGLNFTVYDPSIGEVSGNLTNLCEWYKIPYSRAYQRLRKGWSIEEVLGLDSQHEHLTVNKPVVVDGEQYASFRAACDHFGVSYKLAWRRHKKRSWSIEQAMGVANPPSSVKHGGQKVRVGKRVFKTKASAMRALHIGYKKLLKGIAQGKYELVDE